MSVLQRPALSGALSTGRWRVGAPVAALVITAAVLALRATQLHQSLYGDEVWTYQDVVGHGLLPMVRTVHTGPENSPPLFFVLAWLAARLGDATVLIRLPSLLLGAATVPVLYALGREAFSERIALLGAAILAVSPFSLYYGIEARPYATMAFLAALSTWALLRAVRTGGRRWWLLYALAAAAAAYSHYTSVFVLVAQGAWSLWRCRDRVRAPLLAGALALALYLPWLGHVRGKFVEVIGVLHPLTAGNVVRDLATVAAGYPGARLHAIPTLPGLAAFLFCALAGLLWWLRRRSRFSPEQLLIVLLTAATPVGLLLYSLLGTDLWLPRGVYASVPYLCLTLAAALLALPVRPARVATALALAILAFGTVRALSPSYQRTPYRSVAAYIDRVARPRDPVIAVGLVASAISVYLHHPHVLLSTPTYDWAALPPGGRAWLLTERDSLSRYLHVVPPSPPRFRVLASRRYPGLAPITLTGYRRVF